jgi:predicted NBD/HSP70 family sugar kinase
MNVLVLDIGGRNVKVWRTGLPKSIKIPSGKTLTPQTLVSAVRRKITGWNFDRVSIGYPGEIRNGRPIKDPYNLGGGWIRFDWEQALGHPVRIMNDACMQALGSYEGGRMLYLGLGTSIGTTLIIDGKIVPLALGHLPLTAGKTFEDSLSRNALEDRGVKEWRKSAKLAAAVLKDAFLVDYVVFGGGNAKKLTDLPDFCRRGGNDRAMVGGIRMWQDVLPHVPVKKAAASRSKPRPHRK